MSFMQLALEVHLALLSARTIVGAPRVGKLNEDLEGKYVSHFLTI